ncbi:tRNA pseudouridine(38-40) synthase TruA [Fulvivirga lutea]|uniref:tRNA pseudouridine synthase A n=1 Tax=Fulvivirga lutea TaxID=2810512 RepID=A0A974WHY0_9BACT|nr:tRNA pseudouridine(38-40) synthase TruA [Fulvivirga lutea]QSE98078.1 tRNA pseudouridine(38-40) synthase TruA [Fulvivirga lutea]
MRYFFEIAYNGTPFHGWQKQNNAKTVQEEVEKALSKVLQRDVSILGSGRTDTGVHCEQQFFHLETDDKLSTQLVYTLNKMLAPEIAINNMFPVVEDGHARFSAISRKYEYRITIKKDPFQKDFKYFFNRPLDIKTMNEAAALLIGKQDFESFSKVKTEVNNFVCDITEAEWKIEGTDLIFHIRANRFLRGMVRAVVGTLLDVGLGKIAPMELKNIIIAKNRKHAGAAAPAHGLFLTEVTYPSEIRKK